MSGFTIIDGSGDEYEVYGASTEFRLRRKSDGLLVTASDHDLRGLGQHQAALRAVADLRAPHPGQTAEPAEEGRS